MVIYNEKVENEEKLVVQDHEFHVEDIVWGKIRNQPLWPRQIHNPLDAFAEGEDEVESQGEAKNESNGEQLDVDVQQATLKGEVVVVVEGVIKIGVNPIIVISDSWKTAQAIAKEVGITYVRAKVIPTRRS
ncbi:copper-transporting ATPase RAN1 [Olea europaea subsp. europaea]|uniref:Copper-transporting ATPase RAN1 n=1 Tax=Olea europaea subsp. europaea TaxID=158383 RepID=A0A8S0SBY5_OLEEU|nr:copper-transporting ATPase RAN1 [Olea europaea subsp. europaea]